MKTAARSSPLSRAQVKEIEQELKISLDPIYVETHGDLDQRTSLRALDKTDFFTREVDELVLNKQARISIHAAKDLPEPLPKGLKCIYISKGVDPADALILQQGRTLADVKIVGSSSPRRDKMIKALIPTATCKDIRGAIERRLALLNEGIFDAIVMAEAALIRLKLTHLNRIRLSGETAPLQGKLAILARQDDSLAFN